MAVLEFIFSFFFFIIALSVGECALERYKKDIGTESIKFWKKLLIVFGYAAFSILIVPIAIAKWAVNLTISFKDE